jgi:hypothetical protein
MDIPAISSNMLGSLLPVAPLTGSRTTLAEPVTPGVAVAPSLTTVDLSPLGRFLSAASLLQKKTLELQVAGTTVSESQAREYSELIASTATLAVSFNQLQASAIDSTDVDTDAGARQSLADLFAQQFAALTLADGGDPDTALASLASIGLSFGDNPLLASGAGLNVNVPLLEVALEVDPATTTALLSRAGRAFGAVAQANVQVSDLIADPQPSATATASAAPPAAGLPPLQAAPPAAPTVAGAQSPDDLFLQELLTQGADQPATAAAPGLANAASSFAAPAPLAAPQASGNPQPAAAIQAQDAFVRATQSRTSGPLAPPDSDAAVQELVNASSSAAPADESRLAEQALAERAIALAQNDKTQSARESEREAALDDLEARDRQELIDAGKAISERSAQDASQPAVSASHTQAEQALAQRAADLADSERLQRIGDDERRALQALEGKVARNDAGNRLVEQRRDEQERLQREMTAQQLLEANGPASVRTPAPADTATVELMPAPAMAAAQPGAVALSPQERALQAARDPAMLAAIAAYSLNTGAFAALNARQEAAAQRVKPVPAVSGVSRVGAVESATESKTGRP